MHICFWAYIEMMLFQNSEKGKKKKRESPQVPAKTSVCQKLQHKNIKANASHTNAQIPSRVILLDLRR